MLSFTTRLTSPHPASRHPVPRAGILIAGRAPAHVAFGLGEPGTVAYDPDAGTGFGIGLRVLAEGGWSL